MYQVMNFAAKVALQDGYFDDILPANHNFDVNISVAQTRCRASLATTEFMPLLQCKGLVAGRVYSDTEDQTPVVGIQGCQWSLSMLSLKPLQCLKNPSATATLGAHRSVACDFKGDHALMFAMSVCALIAYPIGYLTIVAMITRVHNLRLVQPGGIAWLKRYAFLFQRFLPTRPYYGLIYILRNLFIAVMPSLLANEVAAQLMLLGLVISSSFGMQCILWPWRSDLGNIVDMVFSGGVLLIIMGGGMLLETEDDTQVVIQIFFFTALIVCFTFAMIAIIFSVWRIGFPPKRYGIFLCHHKDGAAVLARFFKEVMTGKINDRVFLDSDELDALDLIFETVGENTKNLVILISPEVLNRMWCAGEIYSAIRFNVNTVPVKCTVDFKFPTDDFLTNELQKVWTYQQRSELAAFGIELHHIRAAYQMIRDTVEAVTFPRKGNSTQQGCYNRRAFSRCWTLRWNVAAGIVCNVEPWN